MRNKNLNQKGMSPIIILIVLALGILGFVAYKSVITKTPFGKFILFPAKMILSAVTTRSIDPKTGAPGPTVTVFSPSDPVIYLVLKVNKPVKGTKFEYVRYYNGVYVDHNSLETTRDKIDYVSFSWRLKNATSVHLLGTYKVKLYENGIFEKEIFYEVR